MFEEISRRKKQYEQKIILGIATTLISFLLFIPVMFGLGPAGIILIGPPFLGGVVYAGKQSAKIKDMSTSFKEKYLYKELQKIIPDSIYKVFDGFSEQEVVRTGLLNNEDRYHSEDLIEGTYNGVHFKTSDILQEDVERHDGKTRTHTVFHGRFFEFDFNKEFRANILIGQPSVLDRLFSYKKVNMESVEFNRELSVFSDQPHDVFYVLTPHLMERILYLDQKYNDRIKFSFRFDKLFIAINGVGDSFDIQAFKPFDEQILQRYQQEIEDITEFVDILQLNKDIFKH